MDKQKLHELRVFAAEIRLETLKVIASRGSHFILLFQKLQPPNVKGSRVRISNAAPYSLSYI